MMFRIPRYSLRLLLIIILGVAIALSPRQKSMSRYYVASRLAHRGVALLPRDDRPSQGFWEQAIFGDNKYEFIETVRIEGVSLTEHDIDAVLSFPGIENVILENCLGTDMVMERIGNVTSIKSLNISGCDITSRGISSLDRLEHLGTLRLRLEPNVSIDWKSLASLSQLTNVTLVGQSVNDDAIEALASCPSISSLGIAYSNVTDNGLRPLGRLSDLSFLAIRHSPVRGPGLRYLSELPNVMYLNMEGCKLSTDGIEQLAKIHSLRRLWLTEADISESDVQLVKVSLASCDVVISPTGGE